MGDLFGNFIPDEWIEKVLKRVWRNQQWIFVFLTKNPKRLINIEWPGNAWVGATVDIQSRVEETEEAFKQVKAPIKFISCEPLEEKVVFSDLKIFNWLIIGGRNETRKMPGKQPKWEWVQSLLGQAKEANVKVFCRANLLVGSKEEKPREYPIEIQSPKILTF